MKLVLEIRALCREGNPERSIDIGRRFYGNGMLSGFCDNTESDTEYLHLHGILLPQRAAVMAKAFEMEDAIKRALDAIEEGDASGDTALGRANAYDILCEIYRDIEEAKKAAARVAAGNNTPDDPAEHKETT